MVMSLGSFASRVVATAVVATDGTGDFTDIETAINSLPAAGGVVYIKEGTYYPPTSISVTISNVSVIGAGRSTIIKASKEGTFLISPRIVDGFTLRNLTLDRNGFNVWRLVEIYQSNYSIVTGVWFEGAKEAIRGTTATNLQCTDNFIYNCTTMGVEMVEVTNSIISRNTISGAVLTGISLDNSSTIICDSNIVSSGARDGISLYITNKSIVSNNICYDNDVNNSVTYSGIKLDNSDENIISGNRCYDNDKYEIDISNATCNDNFVHGNHCKGADHVGAINDAGTTTTLADNVIT